MNFNVTLAQSKRLGLREAQLTQCPTAELSPTHLTFISTLVRNISGKRNWQPGFGLTQGVQEYVVLGSF